MNKAPLTPAVVRMLTLSTIPPLTYLGVTQYNELSKIELPELPIVEEPEPVAQETTPQIKTRKVGKQTKGISFTSGFSNSYTTYNYSAKQLNTYCKSSKVYQVMRNGCKQAEFSEVEEEIQS